MVWGYAEEVGIHHSSPRTVVTYSGHLMSTGALKSLGRRGATHFDPPMPPPVLHSNSILHLASSPGLVIRSTSVAPITFPPVKIIGSMVSGYPAIAFEAQWGYTYPGFGGLRTAFAVNILTDGECHV